MEYHRRLQGEGAEEMAAFHFLNFARKQKRLAPGEAQMLLASSRSGDRQATDALVDANQVLVAALSETYDDDRLSFMDRIAEGNVALISACRNYQPGSDGSFRRYCQRKIREAVEHALAEAAGLRGAYRGKEHASPDRFRSRPDIPPRTNPTT